MKPISLSRTLELAKLAARVGLKELRSGDIKSRFDQAVLIANSLSSLKGAAMKAGQLLSLDLDNYFPPEAIEILSQLQHAAIAHSFEEIEAVIQAELSSEQRLRLKDLARVPIGVASIGQVHRARVDDNEVVLKVQYPGVADSIDSDLKVLRSLAASFCQLTGRKMNLEPLFQEIRYIFAQEVDYEIEARLQKKYGDHILRLNKGHGYNFRVPRIFDGMSTKRLLTMSYEAGVPLRSWINSKPDKLKKEKLARAILDLYFYEFFEWGLVQTDPNWGNFIVNEAEGVSLCLLDFGATRTYTREFINDYIYLLSLSAEKENQKLNEHAVKMGLVDSRESEKAFVAFQNILTTAIKPFFAKNTGAQYFDFSDRNHSIESQEASRVLARELVYSPPPYSIVFLHRKLAGVYSILKSLEVQMDISSYWQMMRDLAANKSSNQK